MKGVVVVFFLACLVGALSFVHPYGDPRVESAKGFDTLLQGAEMPASAKAVLVGKCADCHSSETRWPVYSHVAPGSWLMERDIVEARKKMDLSQWETTPPEVRDVWMAKIVSEAKRGEMPPLQYLALHWRAKLTPMDVASLSALTKSGGGEASVDGVGDATRGGAVFEKRCMGCHALEADREGPRLAGVYGRKAGGVAGFGYSAALKNSGLTWDEATLERWLSDPDMVVPQNNMGFSVAKAEERRDLIAYLKTAH